MLMSMVWGFFRLRPVFILRAETLSDPLWIKRKKESKQVSGNSNRFVIECRIGSCSSEKREVLFSVCSQEAGMQRVELSSRAELLDTQPQLRAVGCLKAGQGRAGNMQPGNCNVSAQRAEPAWLSAHSGSLKFSADHDGVFGLSTLVQPVSVELPLSALSS